MIRQFDAVELTEELEGWSPGTRGTVMALYPEASLIEVTARVLGDGRMIRNLFDDLVRAPNRALRVLTR